MSRALIIGEAQRTAIRALREKAAAEPIDMFRMNAMAIRRGEPSNISYAERGEGGFKDLTIGIPHGYAITFSVEQQPSGAYCRHLSVAIDRHGKLPSIEAMKLLMQEFGFINDLDRCPVWREEFAPGHEAFNIIEPLDGDMRSIQRRT